MSNAANKNTRYVGSLAPTVTKEMLVEFCEKYEFTGVTANVVQDSLTRKSRCYGYLNFPDAETAEKCHQAINYRELEGQAIRVMPVDRNRYKTAKQHKRNLFIKTLDPKITERQLYDTLTRYFGSVDSVRIIRDKDGSSKGRGFVQFGNASSADTCFEKLQGLVVGDMAVELERYSPKTRDPAAFNNTFVQGLHAECTEEMLKAYFSKAGEVTSIKVRMTDAQPDVPSKCMGHGYVAFSSTDAAKAAIAELNDKKMTNEAGEEIGEPLSVERFVPRSTREKNRLNLRRECNMYVRGFPTEWSDEDLKKHFGQYGDVGSSRVMKRESGESQQFGFVCFKTAEARKAAIEGCQQGGNIFAAPAKSKADREMEKRRQARQQQTAAGQPGNMIPVGAMAQQFNVSPAQLQILFSQFMSFMTQSMRMPPAGGVAAVPMGAPMTQVAPQPTEQQ